MRWLLVLLGCCTLASAAEANATPWHILVIGDSHSARGRWHAHLAAAMEAAGLARPSVQVHAAGGATPAAMAERLADGRWPLPDAPEPRLALVLAGSNAYRLADLQRIVDHLSAHDWPVVVLCPPPRRNPKPGNWGPAQANDAFAREIPATWPGIGPTLQAIQVIDARPSLRTDDHIELDPQWADDAVHLNPAGDERFAAAIAAQLLPALGVGRR